ncbi:hypothetical protein EDC04DRAFT_2713286 [Pisolithus marmoratus]|nr:hypothetical protein EDC04DRAFT_2713286 [Pisolithus marmoratus]
MYRHRDYLDWDWLVLIASSFVHEFVSKVRYPYPTSRIMYFFLVFTVCFIILSTRVGPFYSACTCNLLPDIGMIFPGSCMMQAVVYRGINYGLMRRLQSKLGGRGFWQGTLSLAPKRPLRLRARKHLSMLNLFEQIVGESRGGHRCHIVNCTDRVQL